MALAMITGDEIGGSSVFASGSFVNPTYTIVQLALRLGDHLGRETQAAPVSGVE